MYGHKFLPACAVDGCETPGMIKLDDDRIMCAAHAISLPDKF